MAGKTARDERLNLRTSRAQSQRIRLAAELTGRTVTDFVLASASETAERILADRRWFELDEDRSARFQMLLDRPAVFKPRLSDLLHEDDPYVD